MQNGNIGSEIFHKLLETTKQFNHIKNDSNNKISKINEKILNCFLRIKGIENNQEIYEFLFNNKDLSNSKFTDFSYVISQSFSHVITKFNNVKENEYFRKLMLNVVSNFNLNILMHTFDKLNQSILSNYESMLFFLELIIEAFNSLKHYEGYINQKIFELLNYLTNLYDSKEGKEIIKQENYEKLVLYILYLLLNTNGIFNPKKKFEIFESIKLFLNIVNNKNFLLKIFYIFFIELFEKKIQDKQNILNNINFDNFKNLEITPLDFHKFNYFLYIIELFSSFEPEVEIINLLIVYFQKIFHRFFNAICAEDNNLKNNVIKKNDDYFLLCNFIHVFCGDKIFYQFYLYVIKYSKQLNNNSGIFELFPDIKGILTKIYELCPYPFCFEIIIKLFQNLDELNQNIIYLKEILDIILDLKTINSPIYFIQKTTIFNTIRLLKVFYFLSKEKKITEAIPEFNLEEYILKFFNILKIFNFIFAPQCISMNINGENCQKTILEMCFNISINFVLLYKDDLLADKFFSFFKGDNIMEENMVNETGKSIVFIFDLSNESLNNIINNYNEYHSDDLEKILTENNYKRETKFLLIDFIIQLQMIKINEIAKNNINILDENSYINKFINLFFDDLLILIPILLNPKQLNNNNIYDNIIDSIIQINNSKNYINTKDILFSVFEENCQKFKIKINTFDEANYSKKNFLYNDFSSEKCILKEKCLLLNPNLHEEYNTPIEETKENISSYFDLEQSNAIKCFKKDLLLKDCSIYFNDIFFYDKNFIKIKNSYYYNYGYDIAEHMIIDYEKKNNFLNYPSQLKNFSSNKYALPKIFLNCNTKLYQNKHFSLLYPKINQNLIKDNFLSLPSHFIYYSELLKNIPQSPISRQKIKCELILVKHIIFGEIIFFDKFLVFKSDKKDMTKEYDTNINFVFASGIKELQLLDKIIIILYDEIEEILGRYFAFIPQALEIFLKNGKSYFFNLISKDNLKYFYDLITKFKKEHKIQIVKEPKKKFEELKFTKQWENNEINNEQYLLYLNKYSGRSYNDTNQYPVFPWVTLSKHYFPEKQQIKENDILYRKMEYFIYTQTEKARNEAKINYRNTKAENPKNPFHFRFHYSTGGFVLLYLMRIFPFMEEHIRLQSNNFDSPGRMMHYIEETLNIIKESKDGRELIPEFFSSMEYFLNLNYVYFGQRPTDKILVNNLLVTEYNLCRQKLSNYIYLNKVLLNNRYNITMNQNIELQRCQIDKWINLVFGYLQYPYDINKLNAFEKYSNRKIYSLLKSFDKIKKKKMDDISIIRKINAKKLRVLYFGQSPEQMFTSKHSEVNKEWKKNSSNKEMKLLEKNNKNIKIITFWVNQDQVYFFFLIKNLIDKNMYIYIYDNNMNKLHEVNIGKIKLYNIENIQKKSPKEFKIIDNNNKNNNNCQKHIILEGPLSSFVILDKTKSSTINYKDLSELYCLNPRDAIIDFDDTYNIYFFIGRYKDNTIKIFERNNSIKGILKTKSFVSVLHKKDRESFFSGHMNGSLIEWKLIYKNITEYNSMSGLNRISLKREIKAHNNSLITAINYNERHNIVLTSDSKGILYIRKYYDFELLTKIQTNNENCFTTQILVNDFNLIYTINYDKKELKKFISLYTLNGIFMEKSNFHSINDAYALKSGKIIFNRLEEMELYIFGFNKNIENNEALIHDNILKNIEYRGQGNINNFWIMDNIIYLLLSEGQFIKGIYDNLDLICYGIN